MAQLPTDPQIATEIERVLLQLMAETESAVRDGKDLAAWAPEQLAEARSRVWTMMEMYRRAHRDEDDG